MKWAAHGQTAAGMCGCGSLPYPAVSCAYTCCSDQHTRFICVKCMSRRLATKLLSMQSEIA
jgi:hypothetical protein